MNPVRAVAAFVYDFLADDGWELLVGLAIVLPLTFIISGRSDLGAGPFMVLGLLLTMAVSLARQLRKARHSTP